MVVVCERHPFHAVMALPKKLNDVCTKTIRTFLNVRMVAHNRKYIPIGLRFHAIFGQARPFYCAHQCAVQLAGATVAECDWDALTLLPDMAQLRREVERGVKMVVITTPGRWR